MCQENGLIHESGIDSAQLTTPTPITVQNLNKMCCGARCNNDGQFLRCHPIRENYLAPLSRLARSLSGARAEHNWGLMTLHAAENNMHEYHRRRATRHALYETFAQGCCQSSTQGTIISADQCKMALKCIRWRCKLGFALLSACILG